MNRVPELHPSAIIRVHPVDPCSRHGFDPAIHRYRYRVRYRYRNIMALRHEIQNSRLAILFRKTSGPTNRYRYRHIMALRHKSKCFISTESHPCRPGWETEAASFRMSAKQLGMERYR